MANPKDKNKGQTGMQGESAGPGSPGAAGGQGTIGLTAETAGADNIDTMNTTTGMSPAGSGSTTAPGGGGSLTGAATATARSFVDQAKETAGQAYEAVTEKAASTLDEKKTTLSGGLSTVADSIRQVGQNLGGAQGEGPLPEVAAKYSNTAAQQLESVANYFERKNVREMVRDVESFARRNPGIFIGAAFGLGLLAARFLKSTPYDARSSDYDRNRWHSGQGVGIDEASLTGAGTENKERRTGTQGLTGAPTTGTGAGMAGGPTSTAGKAGDIGGTGNKENVSGLEGGATGTKKRSGGTSTTNTGSTRDSITDSM